VTLNMPTIPLNRSPSPLCPDKVQNVIFVSPKKGYLKITINICN
jgi:hypothetical protein